MSGRQAAGVSLKQKSGQLAAQVSAERPGVLRRLERALPIQDAEDVYQDACVRALERLDQQGEANRLRAWFHAVLRNAVATHIRSSRRAMEHPDAEALLQERPGEAVDRCGCGVHALSRMRSRDRGLLRRALLEEEPIHESFCTDGMTANNARVRLHRARERLRKSWKERCGPCITVSAGADCSCLGPRDARSG